MASTIIGWAILLCAVAPVVALFVRWCRRKYLLRGWPPDENRDINRGL